MSAEKFTRRNIIENIYEKTNIQRHVINDVVEGFLEEVKEALARDAIVELRGFGTFEIRTREAREKVRNPKTGAVCPMARHGVTFFRPGREIKENSWPLR